MVVNPSHIALADAQAAAAKARTQVDREKFDLQKATNKEKMDLLLAAAADDHQTAEQAQIKAILENKRTAKEIGMLGTVTVLQKRLDKALATYK